MSLLAAILCLSVMILPTTALFWLGGLFAPLVHWCFDRTVRRARLPTRADQ